MECIVFWLSEIRKRLRSGGGGGGGGRDLGDVWGQEVGGSVGQKKLLSWAVGYLKE